MLRKLIRNEFERKDAKNNDFKFKITNEQLHKICGTEEIFDYILHQQLKFFALIIRRVNDTVIKELLSNLPKRQEEAPLAKHYHQVQSKP